MMNGKRILNNIIIATVDNYYFKALEFLRVKFPGYKFRIIKNKDNLNLNLLSELNPAYIFFPHWRWIIPEEIFSKYKCIGFHTSNLPHGRGGSPIQNQIIERIYKTTAAAGKNQQGTLQKIKKRN